MAFSRKGQYVATAGKDKIIRIYKLVSGDLFREKSGSIMAIVDICFSADDEYIVSGGDDKIIRLFKVESE